jgi:hypothetical protein
VPGQSHAATPGQQLKPVVEIRRDPLHPEGVYAGGGQLDRQRNSVQLPADVGDDRSVGIGEFELVQGLWGTLDNS